MVSPNRLLQTLAFALGVYAEFTFPASVEDTRDWHIGDTVTIRWTNDFSNNVDVLLRPSRGNRIVLATNMEIEGSESSLTFELGDNLAWDEPYYFSIWGYDGQGSYSENNYFDLPFYFSVQRREITTTSSQPSATPTPTSSASGSSTPTPQPSETVESASNPEPTNITQSEGLSREARIGIGVGVGLGVTVLALVAAVLYLMRRRHYQMVSNKRSALGTEVETTELR